MHLLFLILLIIFTLATFSKKQSMQISKKFGVVITLCLGMVFAQSFAQKPHDDDDAPPKNLKILPKNISGKELHNIMKDFSKSLGVRCNFCHVSEQVEGQQRPKFDFASDNKPEKNTARNMMRMVSAINENYIGKMVGGDHQLESVTCVTCHMGNKTPVIKVDDLKKDPRDNDRPRDNDHDNDKK